MTIDKQRRRFTFMALMCCMSMMWPPCWAQESKMRDDQPAQVVGELYWENDKPYVRNIKPSPNYEIVNKNAESTRSSNTGGGENDPTQPVDYSSQMIQTSKGSIHNVIDALDIPTEIDPNNPFGSNSLREWKYIVASAYNDPTHPDPIILHVQGNVSENLKDLVKNKAKRLLVDDSVSGVTWRGRKAGNLWLSRNDVRVASLAVYFEVETAVNSNTFVELTSVSYTPAKDEFLILDRQFNWAKVKALESLPPIPRQASSSTDDGSIYTAAYGLSARTAATDSSGSNRFVIIVVDEGGSTQPSESDTTTFPPVNQPNAVTIATNRALGALAAQQLGDVPKGSARFWNGAEGAIGVYVESSGGAEDGIRSDAAAQSGAMAYEEN